MSSKILGIVVDKTSATTPARIFPPMPSRFQEQLNNIRSGKTKRSYNAFSARVKAAK